MHRKIFAALVLSLVAVPSASGQDWAVKMFNTTSHDFGTVARGAKTTYSFQIKNLYEEAVHVTSVRSSCGCTTPQIIKPDLKTHEVGQILAEFNTRAFMGQKTATLFVTFDKPFAAEVQLHVSGFIRGDVVLQPGEVDLGAVDQGASVEKHVTVNYAGNEQWKIQSVKAPRGYFETQLKETKRGGGLVSYDLAVRMTKEAPVGYIKDQLVLVTNDQAARELPVIVEGRVVADVTISPSPLFMGVVHPGQKVTKQLIVRAKRPFKITDVKCNDESFEARPSNDAKAVHLVPIVFTAGDKPGRVSRQIAIETDLNDASSPTFVAYAQIVAGPAAAETAETPGSANADQLSDEKIAGDKPSAGRKSGDGWHKKGSSPAKLPEAGESARVEEPTSDSPDAIGPELDQAEPNDAGVPTEAASSSNG